MAPLGIGCLFLNRLLLPRFFPFRRRVSEAWSRQADSFDAPFDDADELPTDFRHTMVAELNPALLLKCGICLALALAGWFAGLSVAWCAMGASAVLLLITGWEPRAAFRQVDWQLLLFVAGLFIVVGALRSHGASSAMLDVLRPWIGDTPEQQGWALTLLTLVGCNVFGNIPFVLVGSEWLPQWTDPRLGAMILAMASTFAGNLMITSSMANVLVRDAGTDVAHIGFREHLRYGVIITLLTTLLGTVWILAIV